MAKQNDFGHMHAAYSAARRGYPAAVYEYLHTLSPKGEPHTLDVGCGTGISTRELRHSGFAVVGADKDAQMIAAAAAVGDGIQYTVAPADALPFEPAHFDLVTAFTAFHWFNDESSIKEISRVMAPGGAFFVGLKRHKEIPETDVFRSAYMAIFAKYAGPNFDTTEKHFDLQTLTSVFGNAETKTFDVDESYTVEEALLLIRSLSIWNLVSEEDRAKMLVELEALYTANQVDGHIVFKREIATITCIKSI